MARTCEEVSLKSSYALVAAGVVLGSLAHGGALYWCLVLMVALCAAAVSVYRALVDENARLYFEKREESAPFIRILIRGLALSVVVSSTLSNLCGNSSLILLSTSA